MAMFNDLLYRAGLSPTNVLLLRHHTPQPGVNGQSIFELWNNDRPGFERYQSVQKPDEPRFRRPIWASFVSPAPSVTMFVGLYDATHLETRTIDWLCPFRGNQPFGGAAAAIFATSLRPELGGYIGRLQVNWDPRNVRTWARYAEGAQFEVSSGFSDHEAVLLYGEALLDAMVSLGFTMQHETSKVFRLGRGNLVAYVKRNTQTRPLVVHPHFADFADDIHRLTGAGEQPQRYINSNLTEFPSFVSPRRQTTGRHGLALDVTAQQLPLLIEFLNGRSILETSEGPVRVVASIDRPLTERERLQAARVGQGWFRNALLAAWGGTCPVTKVDHPTLLRASHIKAWAISSNDERLDPFNGILLGAHVDALFDKHLVSFTDDGTLLISPLVSSANRARLGLELPIRILGLHERHFPFLRMHREKHLSLRAITCVPAT